MTKKNPVIVKRINVRDTLLAITPGEEAEYPCMTTASLSNFQVSASRLNREFGCKCFTVTSPDNGVTAIVRRSDISGQD